MIVKLVASFCARRGQVAIKENLSRTTLANRPCVELLFLNQYPEPGFDRRVHADLLLLLQLQLHTNHAYPNQ